MSYSRKVIVMVRARLLRLKPILIGAFPKWPLHWAQACFSLILEIPYFYPLIKMETVLSLEIEVWTNIFRLLGECIAKKSQVSWAPCGGTGLGGFMSLKLQALFPSVQSKVTEYKISRVSNEQPGLRAELGLSSPPTSFGDKLQKFMVNLFTNKTTEIRLSPILCLVTTSSLLVITVCQTNMTQVHERCKAGTIWD